jgi:hypothetical protein
MSNMSLSAVGGFKPLAKLSGLFRWLFLVAVFFITPQIAFAQSAQFGIGTAGAPASIEFTKLAAASTFASASVAEPQDVPIEAEFNGLYQQEPACGDHIGLPADPAIAVDDGVGENVKVLEAVNNCVEVFNRYGQSLYGPVTLQSFFGLLSGTLMWNSHAQFDFYNKRFVVVVSSYNNNFFAQEGQYNIAVSETEDPLGKWCVYHLPLQSSSGKGEIPYYLRLGQDNSAFYPGESKYPGVVYVAADLKGPNAAWEEWVMLPKWDLYNCVKSFKFGYLFNLKNPDGSPTQGSQPANVWSPFDNPPAELFAESIPVPKPTSTTIWVWAVSNPFGWLTGGPDPEVSAVAAKTKQPYSAPSTASADGENLISAGNASFWGTVSYVGGCMYPALSSRNNVGTDSIVVYELCPTLNYNNPHCQGSYINACPKVTQARIRNESWLTLGSRDYAFYPTALPDLGRNVVTVFTVYGHDYYPSLVYVSQRATQEPGTFPDTGSILARGRFDYGSADPPIATWGVYNAVAPGGIAATLAGRVDTPTAWIGGMYTDSTQSPCGCAWATAIGAVGYPSPTIP